MFLQAGYVHSADTKTALYSSPGTLCSGSATDMAETPPTWWNKLCPPSGMYMYPLGSAESWQLR